MTRARAAAALVVLAVAQIAAAGWAIAKYERTLRDGTLYRMRTVAIDPADAFRGRYVTVRPGVRLDLPASDEAKRLVDEAGIGAPAYVVLATDDEGFARASALVADRPSTGDYLAVERVWPEWNAGRRPEEPAVIAGYRATFPFDRYYMNERAAPEAERRYADALRGNDRSRAWVTVRVRNGIGVIEGLFVDGVPIETLVSGRR